MIKEKYGAWINHVRIVEKIMNEAYHETTEFAPVELHKKQLPERFWKNHLLYETQNIPCEQKIFVKKERIFKKR